MSLSQDRRHRLGQWFRILQNPPQYVSASLIVSLGGLLNGVDTGTIGPVTTMPSFTDSFGVLSSTLNGLVVSSILLPATFSSLFAGAIADSLGRTRAVAIGALFFAIGAALEASAVNLGILIGGRCVVGLGEGLFLSTLVVYVCEISPPNKRGPLATMVQLFITMGLVIGFFTCYGTVGIPSSLSWRLPLALQSGIALILTIAAAFFLPQSPRWLAHKGRKEEASFAWDKLGVSNAEREKDLLQNPATGIDEGSRPGKALETGFRDRIRTNTVALTSVFGQGARKPMLLSVFLMSMQQLSGIDGVIYYAPLLFQEAGISSSEATFLASGISAILIFVFTVLAVFFVDRWGRRASTIYGGLLMFACMTLMAVLYSTDNVHATYGAGKWIVIPTIYVFAIGYCMTWAIGVKLFASEIQPAATRSTAVSLAQSANCITNFFVAFIIPVILSRSPSGIYFLFGGALILTVAVSMVYMPETRGRDLETIGEAFDLQRTRDLPAIRRLKALGSWMGRLLGSGNRARGYISTADTHGLELENRR